MTRCKTCSECPNAHNGLNGRFCNKVGVYVEYNTTPICVNV